ncbi:MAG: MBL fold metallo-hydrolase [Phycisphaeraceae bacterium]|nr:MBL fold metallo-hydrolase [Phycisphaeraceae bacterium]
MSLGMTFLGTGTSSGVPMIGCRCEVCTSDDPRDQRSRPSVLIHVDDPTSPDGKRRWIIDTGPDLRTQIIRADIHRIDGVLYTHEHADHVFGLDDLRRFNAVMDQAIDIHAEPATMAVLQTTFQYIFQKHNNPNKTFVADLIPWTLEAYKPIELHGVTFTPLRLMHGRHPILGFRVDYTTPDGHAQKLAYCTDVSTIPPETYPYLQDLDILVLDGLRFRHHPTHMTVDQALEQFERIGPRQGYLTHMAHEIKHSVVDDQLPEGIHLAYDQLTVYCEQGEIET